MPSKATPFALLDGIIRSAAQCLESKRDTTTFVPGNRLSQLLRKEGAWLCQSLSTLGLGSYNNGALKIDCTSVQVLHDAAYLNRSLLECLFDHESKLCLLPMDSLLSLLNSARFWHKDDFLKNAKYLTAWPIAAYMENDLPAAPDRWNFTDGEKTKPRFQDCFSGKLVKFLRNRLNVRNNLNVHLWWSWLQGIKRGCAPATVEDISQNLIDHAALLSEKALLDLLPYEHPTLVEIRQKCRIFWERPIHNHQAPPREGAKRRTVKVSSSDGIPTLAPTSGASWESPMADGGTHNWLYNYLHYGIDRSELNRWNNPDLKPPLAARESTWTDYGPKLDGHQVEIFVLDRLSPTDLLAMYYDPVTNEVKEERGKLLAESTEGLVALSRGLTDYFHTLRIKGVNCKGRMKGPGRFDHKNVEIIPLCEPLKIRTISKGNALKYWLAKPMQKAMHRMVASYPQMALIKEPLTETHIKWLWSQTDKVLERYKKLGCTADLAFTHVVSGDYKGATDRIAIRATKMCFEMILDMVDFNLHWNTEITSSQYRDTLCDVLYEQLLHYGENGPDITRQTNGQLMGSNLSFPILCAINLIGYWIALEKYLGMRVLPEELPVLVNGDDILFRTPRPEPENPESFYEIWKASIDTLGFKLSVGKNYIHDSIFTVNSECWIVSGGETPSFRRIRHFDVGLLTNNNSAARLENRTLPLADRLNQVLEGARNKRRAWDRLKHYYKAELKEWMQVTRHNDGNITTFNVFAAVPLGGLGVKVPEGVDPNFTNFQRRFSTFQRQRLLAVEEQEELKSCEAIALQTQKFGAGLCYEVPSASNNVQWLKREAAEARFESEPDLELTKDIRNLPTLSRKQPIVQGASIKTFTTRSLRSFRKAWRATQYVTNKVLPYDNDPTDWDYILCRKRLVRMPDSEVVVKNVFDRATMGPQEYVVEVNPPSLWTISAAR